MNERVMRPARLGEATMDAVKSEYDPNSPVLAVELHKTHGLLQRALEVAETVASRLRPRPTGGSGTDKPEGGIVGEAQMNHQLANDLCNRLEEIAGLLG